MKRTLTLSSEELYMLLDAMEGYDVSFHCDGDEDDITKFAKLYKRILSAYRKTLTN